MSGILPHAARLFGIPGVAACAVLLGVRCAHVEPPSGGPADTTPPAVAAVYPAPGAVNVPRDDGVIFGFTEWIDRNAARNQVLISPPFPGRTRVEADGDRLRVRPPAGRRLQANTTYEVTVLGTIPDLRRNPMGREFSLRFSTGSALDSAGIDGTIRTGERRGNLLAALYRAEDRSRAEALSPRDTGFRPATVPEPWRELPAYLAAADSAGRFRIESAVPGDYALFAFEDVNGNFAFDAGLEPAATGSLPLPLRPRAPAQTLQLGPMDTLPLRIAEVAFMADPERDAAGSEPLQGAPGVLRVKFTRPPHPARAAEAARYRVLPDTGHPDSGLPVTAVGWSPAHDAWILETPPLRANAHHRLELRGRPDFPGRHGRDQTDTSAIFMTELPAESPEKKPDWIAIPLIAADPAGLPRTATALAPGARHSFSSSLPLTVPRWRDVETRLNAYLDDTLPVSFRARRTGPVAFTLELSRALPAGGSLELRFPADSARGDSVPRVLYSGKAADSAKQGGLRFLVPAPLRDRTFWLREGAGYALSRAGDSARIADIPAGSYRLDAFHDRDGDGVWDAGALRPWIAQEPYESLLDTVTVTGGAVRDVTERVRGMMNDE